MKPLETQPLHDAILHDIRLDWETGRCIAVVDVFLTPGQNAEPCWIEWLGVMDLDLPRKHPWGPSVHINGIILRSAGEHVIEMQSGDEIRVLAKSAELHRGVAA